MKNYLVFLVILLGSLKGYSQEASLSRWVIGLEAGYNFRVSCPNCPYFRHTHRSDAVPLGVNASYRLFRWLSLQGSFSYQTIRYSQFELSGFGIYGSSGLGVEVYDLQFRLPTLTMMAGPRIQVRVGEGDLGLEFRTGLLAHTQSVMMKDSYGGKYSLDYNWVFTRAEAWRLSYLFWPTSRLALSANFEALFNIRGKYPEMDARSAGMVPNRPSLQRLLFPESDFFGYESFHFSNLLIGIHYRL